MTTVDNTLLKQMQKLASNISAMQSAASKDKGNQAAVSFQEMMQKSSGKTAGKNETASQDAASEKQPVKGEQTEEGTEAKLPVVKKEEEELKPENLAANPNAVAMLDLLRPEIVETAVEAPAEAVVEAVPEEAIPEANMNLEDQMPQMETAVDTNVGAEVSMEQQPKEFGETLQEAPTQEEAAQPVQVQQDQEQQIAPEQAERTVERPAEKVELPEDVEVRADNRTETEEPTGEMAVEETPVFHEAEAVPVKVGERYETVDAQEPQMEQKLADTIQSAVQSGNESIQIRLTPQNLGSLVIEMTKDANGALQVVLHASNAKAAGVLNQHLDGLHTALQGYGHEEVRVEVQRGQEGQEQHLNKQADPDGRGQNRHQQQQERREEEHTGGQEFMQKLRLGLFGTEEL